jgi:hypothetical protein
MTASTILLDPLRHALVSMAIDEKILRPPSLSNLHDTPTERLGRSPKRRAALLELLLLHDEPRIIHHEQPGDIEELAARGYNAISLLPLRAIGLVKFDGRDPDQTGIVSVPDMNPSDFWTLNSHFAQPWAPVLADYVFAKGHTTTLAIAQEYCGKIATPSRRMDIEYSRMLHFSMMSTFGELLQAEVISAETGASCSQPITIHKMTVRDQSAPHRVIEIVLDELLNDELALPMPETLAEALKLREDPNMRAFREAFHPWVTTLRNGTLNDESRLRLEVRHTLTAFRNLPRVRKLNNLLAYVAIPIGLVDAFTSMVAGAAIGITNIGLAALAERWQTRTNWLGFARRDT